jgi:hypothetical protein
MTARKKTPSQKARKKAAQTTPAVPPEELFDRVADIIEQARGNIVRAVNRNMVLAYWLIGREIVEEIQGGKGRAAYGRKVLGELSRKLTERYGEGFSVTNLQNFRVFFQTYAYRALQIHWIVHAHWAWNWARQEKVAHWVTNFPRRVRLPQFNTHRVLNWHPHFLPNSHGPTTAP